MTALPASTARPVHPSTYALLAAAAGVAAANLYYAQPLIALIVPELGIGESAGSLVVTLAQLGYMAGLLFLVPLGDLMENRRLISVTLGCSAVGLLAAAFAPSGAVFFLAAALIGIGSSAAQMSVPFAASLAPAAHRGRVVGTIVSGLMAGILLARPVSSFVAHLFGWRAVFGIAAIVVIALGALLRFSLPMRRPEVQTTYAELIGSLWTVFRTTPLLRRRALYQAAQFCVFTLFWTAVPLLLAGPRFGMGQEGIALFALAGAASVAVSPLAGRIADRGYIRSATASSFAISIIGVLITLAGFYMTSVVVMALGAILLDAGATLNLVLGQRAIFALAPEIRSRLNALYLATFFFGGALGSAVASIVYVHEGWPGIAATAVTVLVLALLYHAGDWRTRRPA